MRYPMNVFSYLLAEGDVESIPALSPTKFVVEDNVGESIHVHYRNVRLEFSVDDFETFAEHVRSANQELNDGDS